MSLKMGATRVRPEHYAALGIKNGMLPSSEVLAEAFKQRQTQWERLGEPKDKQYIWQQVVDAHKILNAAIVEAAPSSLGFIPAFEYDPSLFYVPASKDSFWDAIVDERKTVPMPAPPSGFSSSPSTRTTPLGPSSLTIQPPLPLGFAAVAASASASVSDSASVSSAAAEDISSTHRSVFAGVAVPPEVLARRREAAIRHQVILRKQAELESAKLDLEIKKLQEQLALAKAAKGAWEKKPVALYIEPPEARVITKKEQAQSRAAELRPTRAKILALTPDKITAEVATNPNFNGSGYSVLENIALSTRLESYTAQLRSLAKYVSAAQISSAKSIAIDPSGFEIQLNKCGIMHSATPAPRPLFS